MVVSYAIARNYNVAAAEDMYRKVNMLYDSCSHIRELKDVPLPLFNNILWHVRYFSMFLCDLLAHASNSRNQSHFHWVFLLVTINDWLCFIKFMHYI